MKKDEYGAGQRLHSPVGQKTQVLMLIDQGVGVCGALASGVLGNLRSSNWTGTGTGTGTGARVSSTT